MADFKKELATVADCWKRIEAWLAENNAELHEALNAPASNAEFAQLENVIGARLTDDFKESWKIHNGNGDTQGSLIPPLDAPEDVYGNSTTPGGYYLMPCTEIVQDWKIWKRLVDGGEFVNQVSRPDNGVRNVWWHPGWIPFASNGGGDSICLDLAPTHEGTSGQIITMNHETSERQLLALSFTHWMANLADLIEDGESQEQ